MKKSVFLSVALLSYIGVAPAQNCDCSEYPFKPNPPCYGQCVSKLSAKSAGDTAKVKDIDPGVSLGIGVIAQSRDRSKIDFGSIKTKQDLERAALKSMGEGTKAQR